MPASAPKRKKIEAKLGQSLESFLKEKLAEGLTPDFISREVHLDPSTIRYYIRKFKLSYSLGKRSFKPPHSSEKKSLKPPHSPEKKSLRPPRSSEKKPLRPRLQAAHLDICLCTLCLEISCMEMKKAHELKRCVITCIDFRKKER